MLSNVPCFSLSDILDAIHRDEIFLVAQPQVDLQSHSIVGFEFLARWNNPEYGVLSPFHFIRVLEEARQCHQLTLKMFERMVETVKAFTFNHSGVHYSLNISAHDLSVPEFSDEVLRIIQNYDVNPSVFVLEVTETAGIFSNESVANLRRLDGIGIQLAIDDFWTGFSTLETIRLNVFSEIKIDYSLTSQLINDKASMAGINAILQLSSDLGLRCVVEGIETCMARGILIEAGATIGQGFLFGKGVPDKNLAKWICDYQSNQNLIACQNSTLYLNDEEYKHLEARKHPSWVWDFKNNKVIWANAVAVAFWAEGTIEALLDKKFDGMSYLVKTRLESYRRRFKQGEAEISSEWDFYPQGIHKKVFCIQIPRTSLEGGDFMMVHAFEGFRSRLPDKKYIDSTNRFPAAFVIVNESGYFTRINKHAHIEIDINTDHISEIFELSAFDSIKDDCIDGRLVQTFVKSNKTGLAPYLYVRALMVPSQSGSGDFVFHLVIIPVTEMLSKGMTEISNI